MADYFCLSPSSPAAVSTTTSATPSATSVFSPTSTCTSYLLAPPPCHPHHHVLSFGNQAEQQYLGGGGDIFCFRYYDGDRAVPVAVSQRSSPTTECSSSISSMSSSPMAISSSKPQQALKKKGSRGADQRKSASASTTNKRPRVRKERLGERILALQQLVSPQPQLLAAHGAAGLCLFLATVSLLGVASLYSHFESAMESLFDQLRFVVILSPLLLLLATQYWTAAQRRSPQDRTPVQAQDRVN